MLKHYLKSAFRGISKSLPASSINIGGLASSLAVVLVIALWVQNELTYDTYHKDADHTYLLSEVVGGTNGEMSPFAAYEAIQQEVPEVTSVAAGFMGGHMDLVFEVNNQQFVEKDVLYVDANWVSLFDYDVVAGSFDRFVLQPDAIAISQTKANRFFGNGNAVGNTVLIDSVPKTVAAVFADPPANTLFRQQVLIPHTELFKIKQYADLRNQWGFSFPYIFVKLHPSTAPSSVAAKITEIFRRNQPFRENDAYHHELIALPEIHFQENFGRPTFKLGSKKNIVIFSALAFLLLLTAAVNFINLSVARITLRHKEIGVRKITGAARAQVFGQVLAETVVTVACSMVLTIAFVYAFLPHFNRYFDTSLTFSLFDLKSLGLLSATFLLVTLLTGIYPALLAGRTTPLQLFKGSAVGKTDKNRVREVLIVGQMVLAVVMVVGVVVIQRQYRYMQQSTAAYQMDQVFSFLVGMNKNQGIRFGSKEERDMLLRLETIKQELAQQSAIKAVTRVNGASLIDNTGKMEFAYEWIGYPKTDDRVSGSILWVDRDYMDLAKIEISEGRWFDEDNVSDRHNILINETAIKAFGLNEPVVGTTFNFLDSYQGKIIGVVKDFHHASLHHVIEPLVVELDQHNMGHKYLVEAQGGRIAEALAVTENVWKKHFPGKPLTYTFLDEEFENMYKADRMALVFSLVFAGLSIVVSALGVLAMVMFTAQRRVKEIGIRKVLGASVSNIVAMLSRDFVKLVGIASLVGFPIAWWAATRWLEDYAYHINLQWWMFASAGLLTLLIVLLTVGFQAIKASTANPVDSLRDE